MNAAYGYDGHDNLVPTEAAIIDELACRVLLGEPLAAIAGDLNRRGVTTKLGRKWSGPTIRLLLTNPRIAGTTEGANPRKVPAIISTETRTRLMALFADPTRRANTGSQGIRHMLTGGVLRCSLCGTVMVSKLGAGMKYKCDTKAPRHGCGRIVVAAANLELEIAAQMLARLTLPGSQEAILSALAARPEVPCAATMIRYFKDSDSLSAGRLGAWWGTTDVATRRALVGLLIERVIVSPAVSLGRQQPSLIRDRITIAWR